MESFWIECAKDFAKDLIDLIGDIGGDNINSFIDRMEKWQAVQIAKQTGSFAANKIDLIIFLLKKIEMSNDLHATVLKMILAFKYEQGETYVCSYYPRAVIFTKPTPTYCSFGYLNSKCENCGMYRTFRFEFLFSWNRNYNHRKKIPSLFS